MKKHLPILSFAIFFSIGVYAQPYKSMFGRVSTEWIVYAEGGFTNPWYGKRSHFYDKDTVVKGLTYKKLSGGARGILFREEPDSGRVWYMSVCDTTESLYIDYNLKAGDGFSLSNVVNIPDSLEVVDSVYSVNGRKHIRFKYREWGSGEQLVFIEGVGTNLGLKCSYNDHCGIPGDDRDMSVLCLYHDGYLEYSDSIYGCMPFASAVKEISKDDFQISPNPAKEKLSILSQQKTDAVTITDMQGRIIRKMEGHVKEIDVSELSKGLYILQLGLGGQWYIHKFVKE